LNADQITEGSETFFVYVRTGSASGSIVATSSVVTINDTSTYPAINVSYTTSCAGTTNTSGVISVNSVTGGNGGTYELTIDDGGSWYSYNSSPYNFSSLNDGGYYLKARDTFGNVSTTYFITINCYVAPSSTPTAQPTSTPTAQATSTPTAQPTSTPTAQPTPSPAARYRYLRYTYDTVSCLTTSGPTSVWSYQNVASGFYTTDSGDYYLVTSNHSDNTTEIFIGSQLSCVAPSPTPTRTPAAITATVSGYNVLCNGGSSGSIIVYNVAGGFGGPYQTKLNAGGTYTTWTSETTYGSLTAGAYTIYVKDSASREVTFDITITQPNSIGIFAQKTAFDQIYASVSGGASGFKTFELYSDNDTPYSVGGGTLVDTLYDSSNVTFNSVVAGYYYVKATDGNGCSETTAYLITI
jgi:hypothetical protein